MKFLLESSPHDRNESSQTSVIMLMIIVGLIPAVIMHIYCFGLGLLWHLLISCPLAALVESVCLKLRGYSAVKGMKDFSIQVTAVIYCLAIPPYLSLGLTAAGIIFATVIVKQCFGGLGQNTFNPAMAAYVLLLVSFPGQMTAWIAPSPENFEKLGFSASLEVISGQKTVSEAMVLHGSSMGSSRKAEVKSAAAGKAAEEPGGKSRPDAKSVPGAKEALLSQSGADAATQATVQAAGGSHAGVSPDGKTGATQAAGRSAAGKHAPLKDSAAGGADAGTQATASADSRSGATPLNGTGKAGSSGADVRTGATAAAGAEGKTGATAAAGKAPSEKAGPGKAEGRVSVAAADAASHATAKADAATYATPLSKYKTEKSKNGIYYPYVKKGSISELDISAYGVKVVSLAFLLGGLVLLVTRMIFISVPLSVLGSVAFFSWMYQVLGDAGDFPVMTVTDQLLTGATMMGAFFIYTDPVGSASTTRAKIISGILVGFFIVTVRNFGGYPDAVAFGALIANSINPLLDRLVRPIRFGRLGEAA